MIKIQLVCQQCGNSMELRAETETAEESYYNNFGYLEENTEAAIRVGIEKIVYDLEHKPFDVFEFI